MSHINSASSRPSQHSYSTDQEPFTHQSGDALTVWCSREISALHTQQQCSAINSECAVLCELNTTIQSESPSARSSTSRSAPSHNCVDRHKRVGVVIIVASLTVVGRHWVACARDLAGLPGIAGVHLLAARLYSRH